jgi:tryptophan-rich sensory protein
MSKQNIIRLSISLAICYLAGAVGSIFTRPAVEYWYQSLIKPGFAPPDWLFAPVWLMLYAVMGFSFYLVWRSGLQNKDSRSAFILFLVHLLVNVGWSVAFFGFQSPFWGLMMIILLWGLIFALVMAFAHVRSLAAVLLIPYWAWVTFAGVLNWTIWLLN